MPLDKEKLHQLKLPRPDPPRASARRPLTVASILLALVAGGAWWWWQRPRPIEVETTRVRLSSPTEGSGTTTLLNASGYVTARRAATVSSKVTGRVVEVLIEEGMSVAEGQVLARVDASNVEQYLRLAEAQEQAARAGLGETEANLELAQRTLERTNRLSDARVVSEASLDEAKAAVRTLEARLQRQRADIGVAESEVARWKQELADTVIRAPFAGVVVAKNAQPGEMISPISAGGGFTRTGICTIVDMSSLEIEVDVSESYINRVQPGQRVVATLDAYPEWRIPAEVIAIIPTADRQKASVQVRIGFRELDPRILPDMSLKVAFQAEPGPDAGARATGVVVPRRAVRRTGDRDVVWVLNNESVERRAISIGATTNGETLVTSGLRGGETLVLDPPPALSEGARVRPRKQ